MGNVHRAESVVRCATCPRILSDRERAKGTQCKRCAAGQSPTKGATPPGWSGQLGKPPAPIQRDSWWIGKPSAGFTAEAVDRTPEMDAAAKHPFVHNDKGLINYD